MPLPARVKTGDSFGEWIVVEYRPGHSLCRCSCGTEKLVYNGHLLGGKTRKCRGCMRKGGHDLPWKAYYRVFLVAQNAIRRCTEESNIGYENYGERGITVHPDWLTDCKAFTAYLLTLPGCHDPKLVLDRIDNDGNYEPGNLAFVTRSESSLNRRPWGHKLRKDDQGRFTEKTG